MAVIRTEKQQDLIQYIKSGMKPGTTITLYPDDCKTLVEYIDELEEADSPTFGR